MSLQHTFAIVLRQYYLLRGSFSRVLPLFMWVAIDILLWGFLSKYLNSISSHGPNFVPVLLGAVLLWDFLVRVMQGITMAFFEDVWSRNFLNLFATPLTTTEYVGGLILSSIATSSVGLVVMIVLSATVFDLTLLAYGFMLIPFLLILFLFGISLGVVGTSIVLRLGPAAEWFVWPIPAIISPFAGVFYPISTLPMWMQYIGWCLPASHVFEGMRLILSGQPLPLSNLLWGGLLAIVYMIIAGWIFNRTYAYVVRTGLIARYSAESVS